MILMMEVACSSETLVEIQWTTRRYFPENRTLHKHRSENLNSYTGMTMAANSTGVPRHTGVTRRVRRFAAGVWEKVEKKREKI
jgi:hypothetical protein